MFYAFLDLFELEVKIFLAINNAVIIITAAITTINKAVKLVFAIHVIAKSPVSAS